MLEKVLSIKVQLFASTLDVAVVLELQLELGIVWVDYRLEQLGRCGLGEVQYLGLNFPGFLDVVRHLDEATLLVGHEAVSPDPSSYAGMPLLESIVIQGITV